MSNTKCNLVGLSVIIWIASTLMGQASNDNTEGAIKNGSHNAWYNAKEKTLVFPLPSPMQSAEDDLEDRHRYDYDPSPSTSSGGWWDWSAWRVSIGSFFGALANSAWWLFWISIALLALGIVVYLSMAVERGWYTPFRRNLLREEDLERDVAKIVDLPFNLETPIQGLLSQAEAYRRSGNYSGSIVYLFSHILVELDEASCIRLQRGKTNRAYLRELKDEPRLADLHRTIMQVFEAVFFGRYVVSRDDCDRCWNLLPLIQRSAKDVKNRKAAATESIGAASAMVTEREPLTGGMVGSIVVSLVVFVGCNKNPLPLDAYGDSHSMVSHKSVSGLSVFRSICEERGMRTFLLAGLSQRSKKLNTILWAPKDFRLPSSAEIRWYDAWLTSNTPKTLIFVGRDYSPASHYWQQAALTADPKDRRTYRLRQAYVDSQMEAVRYKMEPEEECGWFRQQLDPDAAYTVKEFKGPWAKDLKAEQTNVVLRGLLKPNTDNRTVTPSTTSNDTLKTADSGTFSSDTDADGLDDFEVKYGAPKITTWLRSESGVPIVSSISYKPWGASRLILVANGSLFMNESLTHLGNQQLAERLIDECKSEGRIGFLSNTGETWIRAPWDEQEPKGFELLRVWPLSLISIQGLFIGAMALLAMLPIFGRPQRLPSQSTTDFGKHIEALGYLLHRSRDRNYALQRIADYFRNVRRDTASPWANVAPPTPSPHSIATVTLKPTPDPVAPSLNSSTLETHSESNPTSNPIVHSS